MERVNGIGGVFFRSGDRAAVAAWYEQHLGVTRTPAGYEDESWTQVAGPTVFEPFPDDTDYFGPSSNQFMINFRVADLAAMIAQLRGAGIEVTEYPEQPNGRFAHLSDPEGRRIELWQPSDPSSG